jgi:hypothetical protein
MHVRLRIAAADDPMPSRTDRDKGILYGLLSTAAVAGDQVGELEQRRTASPRPSLEVRGFIAIAHGAPPPPILMLPRRRPLHAKGWSICARISVRFHDHDSNRVIEGRKPAGCVAGRLVGLARA